MADRKISEITQNLSDPADDDRLVSTDMTGAGTTGSSYTEFADARKIRTFASEAARDAAVPSPVTGYPAYIQDTQALTIYDGTTWDNISSGTSTIVTPPASGTATATIQAAIDAANAAGGGLVHLMLGTYTVDRIDIKSNVRVYLAPGVTVEANTGFDNAGNIFRFDSGVTDAGLYGYGAHITMNGIYNTTWGQAGVRVNDTERIVVAGMKISECGGDGIQLTGANPTDVLIKDVWCYRNRRQGISVIGGDGVTITRCTFEETGRGISGGTPPMAGVDFEPEAGRMMHGIILDDCDMINNVGNGVVTNIYHLTTGNTTVTINNCRVIGNEGNGVQFYNCTDSYTGTGQCLVQGCEIRRNGGIAVWVVDWWVKGPRVSIDDCFFEDNNTINTSGWEYRNHVTVSRPLAVEPAVPNEWDLGNVVCRNCNGRETRSLSEFGSFTYNNGSGTEPKVGDVVNDTTNGGTGTISKVYIYTGGWGTNNATGSLSIVDATGTFGAGGAVSISSGGNCNVDTPSTRQLTLYFIGGGDSNHAVTDSTVTKTRLDDPVMYIADEAWDQPGRLCFNNVDAHIRINAQYDGEPTSIRASAGSTYVQTDGESGKVFWRKAYGDDLDGWESLRKIDNSIWVEPNGTDDMIPLTQAMGALWSAGGGNLYLYEGTYYVDQFRILANVTVHMQPGTVIRPTATFSGPYLIYFYEDIDGVSNAKLAGNNGLITYGGGKITDRAIGIPGNANGITIEGVRFKDCGDSAILLIGATPKNITIRDCWIESSYNSGIYVASVDHLLVDNCIIRDCGTGTDGAGPTAFGIYALAGTDSLLKDIVVRDTLIENNVSGGLLINLSAQTTAECSMTFRGCKFNYSGISFQTLYDTHAGGGVILFDQCTIEDAYGPSFMFTEWYSGSVRTIISDCQSKNPNVSTSIALENRSHVSFYRAGGSGQNYDMGNVIISGCNFLSTYAATDTGRFDYSGGINTEPKIGEGVTDDTTGATGIVATINVSGGDWGSGNASGLIRVRQVKGTFGAGNTCTFDNGGQATVGTVTAAVVPTQCVYGVVGNSTGFVNNVLLSDAAMLWEQAAYNTAASFLLNTTNSKLVCDVFYAGAPTGNLTASPGSRYMDTDGGVGATLYVKETNDDETGWAAK